MFCGSDAGIRIQRLLKNLPNRFDGGKNIPANNVPTFGVVFQFAHPFGDGNYI